MIRSDLPPGWRHVLHVLCAYTDADSGAIPAQYTPSLTRLADDTGMNRRTIIRHLAGLEQLGWVTRQRPAVADARRLHARTRYAVLIGRPKAGGVTPPELAASVPYAGGVTPPELGAVFPVSRGTTPPRPTPTDRPTSGDTAVVIEALKARTGVTVTPEWAAEVAAQIIGVRDVRDRAAYLRTAIANAPAAAYRPTPQPPRLADLCSRCMRPGHPAEECPDR